MNEDGFSSVQFLLASAMALVLFLALANLVVVQYGRGAIRSALEQGARVGAISGSELDCVERGISVARQLLGGRMSDGLTIECSLSGDRVIATAAARFESWTVFTPDFVVTMRTEAVRGRGP